MKHNKPKAVKMRKAKNVTTNVKRNVESSVEERKKKVAELFERQAFVDAWNNEYVGSKGMDDKDLTEHFKNVQLESGIVVQMYMENPLKEVLKTEDDQIISVNYGIQQIDYRKKNTDTPMYGPTPFPLVDKGVIMAISPAVKLWYYEQKEKLNKYDPKAASELIIPEVGDVIYTSHFLFKEARYYVDKQAKCEDFVKSQDELRLNNFDMLFKITNYDVEAIVKVDDKAYDNYGSKIVIVPNDVLNEEVSNEQPADN